MQEIYYPIFVIHTDNEEEIDGILWIEDQVLDDKNMKGKTLGERRLQTPMKSLYPLRYMIDNEIDMLKHRGKNFIDNLGNLVYNEKSKTGKLIYHKILRRVKKDIEDSTGKSNFDLASNLLNSTTVNYPETFLPLFWSRIETQLTVPPVASRSSTIAYELNFFKALFCIESVFSPYSKL